MEREEDQPEFSKEDREEMEKANEDFKKLFKEIGDTMEYQNLHYMIPLKSRKAAEVEAAIRLLYVQIRAEGLPIQRVHSDRARELRGKGIRQWLLQRDVYPTTGEAQVPQSNGRAEQVVKTLKQRAKDPFANVGITTIVLAVGYGSCCMGSTRICSGTRVASDTIWSSCDHAILGLPG